MNPRTRLLELLRPGTKLTCLENSAVPRRVGAVQVVTGSPTADGVPCSTLDGVAVSLRIPDRKYLTWLDDYTASWPLGGKGTRLAKHKVTWRIVPA